MFKRFGIKFFFCVYIIWERRQRPAQRQFGPWFDLLPDNYEEYPLFYKEDELEYLKGSPSLEQLQSIKDAINGVYEVMSKEIEEFKELQVHPSEFNQIMTAIYSRSIGLVVNGELTTCLVPYFDMLNHRRSPDQTFCTYNERRQGFTIEALENIRTGSAVCYNYGRRIDSFKFFFSYGFIQQPNDQDSIPLALKLLPDDLEFKSKAHELHPNLR